MHDPFSFACPTLLSSLTSKYIATPLHFYTLPLHIHEILLSAVVYHLICIYLSPFLSTRLFPKIYPNLNWRTKLNWDVHVVSLFQSCFINVLALWILFGDAERGTMDWRGRIWGYTGALGLVEAGAVGYFLWDLVVCAIYIDVFGWGLLAHAVSALVVYAFGFVGPLLFSSSCTIQCDASKDPAILRSDELTRPFSAHLSTPTHPCSFSTSCHRLF